MKIPLYATDVLEEAIARLRAGETLGHIGKVLKRDRSRLSQALRVTYPEAVQLLKVYKSHDKKRRGTVRGYTSTATLANDRSPGYGYTGFVDTRARDRITKEHEHHREAMSNGPRGWVRGMDEFSDDELRALDAKLKSWLQSGVAWMEST